MENAIKITISVQNDEQMKLVSEALSDNASGLRIDGETLSDKRMNSDLGLYIEMIALVLSVAGAAESIFSVSDRLKANKIENDFQSADSGREVKLTIQKDGTSYEVTNLNVDQIKKIIEK